MADSNCKTCGQPVTEIPGGTIVHVGGGTTMQKCGNCGWSGGMVGGFDKCPGCGDATQLRNDHNAS